LGRECEAIYHTSPRREPAVWPIVLVLDVEIKQERLVAFDEIGERVDVCPIRRTGTGSTA
jgi:hypothetical protein